MTETLPVAVQSVVEHVMDTYQVPGIAVGVVRGGAPIQRLVLGVDAVGQPLAHDSLFPVASITKLATALTVLRLADADAVALDDPVARYLPDAVVAQDGVTLRSLLIHTSGLPNFYDEETTPWADGLDWPTIARACLQTQPITPPNTSVTYSNVGYALLAVIVERVTEQPFPEALRSLVLDPLSLEAFLGVEPPRPPVIILDTSDPNRGTPREFWNSRFFRALAEPYGGLVTTLDAALRLVGVFQGIPAGFLHSNTIAIARQNHVGMMSGVAGPFTWPHCPWGLGPELRGTKTPHWAPLEASPDSFGHGGSSGCIVWADPTIDLSWAILSTRAMDSDWLLNAFPQIGAAILTMS